MKCINQHRQTKWSQIKQITPFFLLFTLPITAQAGISMNCQPVSGGTQCTLTGQGSNLSALLMQAINQYPNNLVLNVETSNTLNPFKIKGPTNNITLHLAAGVTLTAPAYGNSAWKGYSALIEVINSNQFTVSGDNSATSIIDGNGKTWWQHTNVSRPDLFEFYTSNSLMITGIQAQNAPMYHFYIENSHGVTVHDMNIYAPANSPSTDGIHTNSASNVNIYNLTINNGDDAVAINSSPSEGPSTNIQINNLTLINGHGISIGSGVFSNVSNMTVSNVTLKNSQYGLRIKTRCNQANCSDTNNVAISGISYQNITMDGVHYPIQFNLDYNNPGQFSNVTINNITYSGITATNSVHAASLLCEKQNQCFGINFNNVNIDKGGQCQGIDGGSYNNPVKCPF